MTGNFIEYSNNISMYEDGKYYTFINGKKTEYLHGALLVDNIIIDVLNEDISNYNDNYIEFDKGVYVGLASGYFTNGCYTNGVYDYHKPEYTPIHPKDDNINFYVYHWCGLPMYARPADGAYAQGFYNYGLRDDSYNNSTPQKSSNDEEWFVYSNGYAIKPDYSKASVQLYLDKDTDYELLKQTLLKKSKDFPANELYSEMLIWLYVQRKDFDNALVQTRAIDKRQRKQGQRILLLADLAVANQKYDAADKAYNEVLLLGNDKPFYINAKLGILHARNQKIFYSGNLTPLDLTALETEYNNFLKEFGRYPFTAQSIRELAHIQAYYLYKYPEAINNYNELINMARLDNRFKAECKLDLGDIYVLKGEEWEAMLLYGQVDKEFLEDPLGQEAKFRNAKLSYYLGEFEWARAQLDVLKTATTQLIANNAIELSLQIQDNTIDSNEEPMRWFARADLYLFQNRITDATRVLDSIEQIYPKHELTDDVTYKRAEIAIKSDFPLS
jgi:hypothetical protein